MRRLLLVPAAGVLLLSAAAQQPGKQVQPGAPVTIHVAPAPPSAPSVTIALGARQATVIPHRQGLCHTGGGNIDVAQPSADSVVITMTGVAVAVGSPCAPGAAGMDFNLDQQFEVAFEKADTKAAKLTLEGRIIGLLRSHRCGSGTAEASHGCVTVVADSTPLAALCLPDQAAAAGDNQSLNARQGPVAVRIGAGKFSLRQVFHILVAQPRSLLPCKAVSAEFAPDPALDPLWISYWEPFHGASKKDFGFQVTLKVAPETDTPAETIPVQPRTLGADRPR
jgi:hypothetical protein